MKSLLSINYVESTKATYISLLAEGQSASSGKEPSFEPATATVKEIHTELVAAAAPQTVAEPSTSSEFKPEEAQSSATAAVVSASSSNVASSDLASAAVVQSMFAYKACQPDEMTFPEGVLIDVLAHEEEGWWRGRIQSTGVEGLFPVNYVKPYHVAPSSSDSALASSSSTAAAKPCEFRAFK